MRKIFDAVAFGILAFALNAAVYGQQAVLQRGYDAGLSGANLTETKLTASNVNPSTFGLLQTLPVDDRIYAQPLYVPNVSTTKGTHNVLYVATMSDSLYAFDADVGGDPLWSVNFASSVGAVPVQFANFIFGGNTNLVGNLGILSTPVIDPTTNIMYLVACTLEGGTMVYRLHAVNIKDGTEPYPNVVIHGSYHGVAFDAAHQTQRVSLTLTGNQVVFAFGAVEEESDDKAGYAGWVMSYNKQTLAQSGAFATVTSGSTLGGGVWQSGRAPVVDGSGFVYVFTGNGFVDGYDGVNNFSETALKLDPTNGLALVDWFTPNNWSTMDSGDKDLSSSGPLLIPGTNLLAGGGKTGVLYVLNTSNLGHYSSSDSSVVQEETIGASSLRGGPVFWQRTNANGGPYLYDWASSDGVKAYQFLGTSFAASPSSSGSGSQIYPGGILTLSANGQQQGTGVLWATAAVSGNVYSDPTDPGVLYAFDADNVGTQLYSSLTNSARDNYGNFAKLVPPLVANGKVYVATFSDQVAVYGLLGSSTPQAAAPTFGPAPGSYTSAQSVTLSDSTSGAVIYYTTNGTAPTTASSQYAPGTPIPVNTTTTIEAMAVASGYSNSAVAVGTYTISAGGGGGSPVSVSLSASDSVVAIGNGGTTFSGGMGGGYAYAEALLGTSLTWSGSTFALGSANVADAATSKTITLPAGSYSGISLLATGINGNQANQTFVVKYTDGTTTSITQSLSDWFTPQHYAGESIASTMAYRVKSDGTLDNRTFYLYGYTLAINSAKTVQSIALPSNVNVVVLAIDVVPSGGTQPTSAATPTFGPAPGTYTSAQSVTLSDTTSGAVIYYTTNGTAPTTASSRYASGTPIPVKTTTTIEAMAVAGGYSNSAVAVGTYTISAGSGGSPVSVSLSASDSLVAIGNAGTTFSGGMGGGYAYAEALLGTSLTWSGATFTLGSANVVDAVSNRTITLPAGNYSGVSLLATGIDGNQANQTFVVKYTDGTTTSITQSLSDWFTPQHYAGESIASTMAYRVKSDGTLDNRTFYLYGYTLAINSAKTVQSIALPNNVNVVVLAIDVVPSGSTQPASAATPTFGPAPGSYTSAQSVTVSDSTSGAVIYYTTNGTAPTTASSQYAPGTPIPVNTTTTIEAMAVASGYSNSAVAVGTYKISASGGSSPVSVSLSASDSVVAIGNGGTTFSGGMGGGYAYAEALLGTSLTWSGSTFALGSANVGDAATSKTITLPAGSYSGISLLATGINGNQANQTFVVKYTDGTTTSITQSLSDWFTPQHYAGESIASTMAYRVKSDGTLDNRTFYLYGYTLAINSAKTVQSIALPSNVNVVVLSVDLEP